MIWVDLQRTDGSTIAVLELDDYQDMSANDVAETVPHLFIRGRDGARVDLGTMGELSRALQRSGR